MLLPSLLSCDARPSLYRFQPYHAPSRTDNPYRAETSSYNRPFANSLFSTCRALQSILGVYPSPSTPRSICNQLSSQPPSPIQSLQPRFQPSHPPNATPRRRVLKRRRSHSFSISSAESTHQDQENAPHTTPKRHRHAPPNTPFGLQRKDFYALQPTPTSSLNQQLLCSSGGSISRGAAVTSAQQSSYLSVSKLVGADNRQPEADENYSQEVTCEEVDEHISLEHTLGKMDLDRNQQERGVEGYERGNDCEGSRMIRPFG